MLNALHCFLRGGCSIGSCSVGCIGGAYAVAEGRSSGVVWSWLCGDGAAVGSKAVVVAGGSTVNDVAAGCSGGRMREGGMRVAVDARVCGGCCAMRGCCAMHGQRLPSRVGFGEWGA